jgi:hypothetical protein
LQTKQIVIYNLDDNSLFASPVLDYSLGDDTSVSLGAMLYFGDGTSEFGSLEPLYYIKGTSKNPLSDIEAKIFDKL